MEVKRLVALLFRPHGVLVIFRGAGMAQSRRRNLRTRKAKSYQKNGFASFFVFDWTAGVGGLYVDEVEVRGEEPAQARGSWGSTIDREDHNPEPLSL